MKYFYVQDKNGAIYGSFDSKALADQFAAKDPNNFTLIPVDVRNADIEHDGNSHHLNLD
jgi:hypothetical protein